MLRRLLIVSLASLIVLSAASASAVEEGSGQALEIAPPVVSLTADPGEVINTQISIRDVAPTSLIVTSQVNDFTSSDREDGTPVLLGVDEPAEPSPYSIIPWVDALPELQLAPREIEKLPVTIRVPKDAAPGGYYGVIRFTATPPELDQTGVSLSASLGALVFIRVNGDAKEGISIEEFYTELDDNKRTLFEGKPVNFVMRVKNTGNVHEQPVGKALIKDSFGNNIANLNINLEGRNVLPQTIRKFTTSLDKEAIGDKFLFGRYTADLTVKYGVDGQTVTASTAFWVIPWKLMILALIVILGLVFGFRHYLKQRDARLAQRYRRRR